MLLVKLNLPKAPALTQTTDDKLHNASHPLAKATGTKIGTGSKLEQQNKKELTLGFCRINVSGGFSFNAMCVK